MELILEGEPVPPEHHADHVVVLDDAGGSPVLGIIVEVQLGKDKRKRFSWPAYQNVLRAQLRAPVCHTRWLGPSSRECVLIRGCLGVGGRGQVLLFASRAGPGVEAPVSFVRS